MNLIDIENLAKQKLNDPNPDIARKAQAALMEIQQRRSPQGLAQMYSQARGTPEAYMQQMSRMSQSSPWAGMRTMNSMKFDADTFGEVNGQKTWNRQLDEADATGQLNGQWTQKGRINEGNITGYDPASGKMTYNTQVQERNDYGVDPVTKQQTMAKINNDRNYNLNVRQENRIANAPKATQPDGLKYMDYYKEVKNRLDAVTESPRSYTDASGNVKELKPSKTQKYKPEAVVDYILGLPIDKETKLRLIQDTGLGSTAQQMMGG
jgi:hypothetical protein